MVINTKFQINNDLPLYKSKSDAFSESEFEKDSQMYI